MKFTKVLIVVAALLACAASAQSQTLPVTGYDLKVYAVGAPAPISTSPLTLSEITCNLAPTPAGASTVNPTSAEWDDTLNAGKVCRWVPTGIGSGPIVSLPNGSYEGTIVAKDEAGTSLDSNRAPFVKAPQPGVRTGLRFVRSGT